MPLLITCPLCKTRMQTSDDAVGKQVICPGCRRALTVGGMAKPPAPPVAPPPRPPSQPAVNLPPVSSNGQIAPAPLPPPSPPASPAPAGQKCPVCGSIIAEGQQACLDCGFQLQPEPPSPEPAPAICPNPSCNMLNAPGTRQCARCGEPMPMPPGTILQGRYLLEKLLAMGGFGAVYKGKDLHDNRVLAVKEMLTGDPQEYPIRLKFFRREAEILGLLQSQPIVPRVYDYFEQDRTAYLILEFIPGRDMIKVLEANRWAPFPIEQVIEWGKLICDLLEIMHNQDPPLIYRDLKPENIMLGDDGKSIRIIDFGTARDFKERGAPMTVVYSEDYAPPEQRVGKPEPRSDLFALAATLYHLVTGQTPEGRKTGLALADELKDPNCPYPAEYRWFYELIRVNLDENLKKRHPSAKAFKADLERRQVTGQEPAPAPQAAPRPAASQPQVSLPSIPFPPPPPPPPPALLAGRYRLEDVVGVGLLSTFARAQDTQMAGRLVTVRQMLCLDAQERPWRQAFFRREAEVLRWLDNVPILPRYFELLEQGPDLFLVTEVISGRSLAKILQQMGRPFPLDVVISWGKALCDLLDLLHSRKPPLLCLDLRPESIFWVEEKKTIKLMELGMLREPGDRVPASIRLIVDGTSAPPEQVMGRHEPRSDLFTLASLLYHLATGRPCQGYHTYEELRNQLNDPACADLFEQRWFYELIRGNLVESPDHRYPSPRVFKACLEHQRALR